MGIKLERRSPDTWSGVYFRDDSVATQYDYAIIFLQDTQAVFDLSWQGVYWWDSASGYNGQNSFNLGYPCGPNIDCDSTPAACDAVSGAAGSSGL